MNPTVTILLSEYNFLKDMEKELKDFTNKIKIAHENNPVSREIIKCGVVNYKELNKLCNYLVDIDKLVIEND